MEYHTSAHNSLYDLRYFYSDTVGRSTCGMASLTLWAIYRQLGGPDYYGYRWAWESAISRSPNPTILGHLVEHIQPILIQDSPQITES